MIPYIYHYQRSNWLPVNISQMMDEDTVSIDASHPLAFANVQIPSQDIELVIKIWNRGPSSVRFRLDYFHINEFGMASEQNIIPATEVMPALEHPYVREIYDTEEIGVYSLALECIEPCSNATATLQLVSTAMEIGYCTPRINRLDFIFKR